MVTSNGGALENYEKRLPFEVTNFVRKTLPLKIEKSFRPHQKPFLGIKKAHIIVLTGCFSFITLLQLRLTN